MQIGGFADRVRRLFHVCPVDTAASVADVGLSTATGLLVRAADDAGQVEWSWADTGAWETCHWRELNRRFRRVAVRVRRPGRPETAVVLRDQAPLGNLDALEEYCLVGMTGAEWIERLNERLYLFPSVLDGNGICEAGDRFRNKYGRSLTRLAVIETARLPAAAVERLGLSTLNGGTIRGLGQRGPDTYRPLGQLTGADVRPLKEITVREGLSYADLRACCVSPWVLAATPESA